MIKSGFLIIQTVLITFLFDVRHEYGPRCRHGVKPPTLTHSLTDLMFPDVFNEIIFRVTLVFQTNWLICDLTLACWSLLSSWIWNWKKISISKCSHFCVLQVVIESGTVAKEYETIPIDVGSPVNKDMAFDRPKEHVYVMTAKKVGTSTCQSLDFFSDWDACLMY